MHFKSSYERFDSFGKGRYTDRLRSCGDSRRGEREGKHPLPASTTLIWPSLRPHTKPLQPHCRDKVQQKSSRLLRGLFGLKARQWTELEARKLTCHLNSPKCIKWADDNCYLFLAIQATISSDRCYRNWLVRGEFVDLSVKLLEIYWKQILGSTTNKSILVSVLNSTTK